MCVWVGVFVCMRVCACAYAMENGRSRGRIQAKGTGQLFPNAQWECMKMSAMHTHACTAEKERIRSVCGCKYRCVVPLSYVCRNAHTRAHTMALSIESPVRMHSPTQTEGVRDNDAHRHTHTHIHTHTHTHIKKTLNIYRVGRPRARRRRLPGARACSGPLLSPRRNSTRTFPRPPRSRGESCPPAPSGRSSLSRCVCVWVFGCVYVHVRGVPAQKRAVGPSSLPGGIRQEPSPGQEGRAAPGSVRKIKPATVCCLCVCGCESVCW